MSAALDNLSVITDGRSRRSSSWDRTGGNVDCLTDLAPGATAVLLDTPGPGKVTHIWVTVMEYPGHDTLLRDAVIRMYWDNEKLPSVEAPLGDFFGLGHTLPPPFYMERRFVITSAALTVGINERAMNCYWPMPFQRAARIEVFNNGSRTLRIIYFHVDYELGAQPENCGYFHARFRQERELHGQDLMNLDGKDNYVLLETEGRGHYAGCFLYVDSGPGGWWGEGDDMIFIDHDPMPTINGTGTEDYFNNAWCYHSPFSYPYFGCPLLHKREDGGSYTTMYRFHIPDPVRFSTHIKVTMEHYWDAERTVSFTSVAFWYQDRPVPSGPALPHGKANYSLLHGEKGQKPPTLPDVDVTALEVPLREQGIGVRTICVIGQQHLHASGAVIIDSQGKEIEVALDVPDAGAYRVEVKPVYSVIEGPVSLRVGDGKPIEVAKETYLRETDGPYVNLGNVIAEGNRITVRASGTQIVPIHKIRLIRLD